MYSVKPGSVSIILKRKRLAAKFVGIELGERSIRNFEVEENSKFLDRFAKHLGRSSTRRSDERSKAPVKVSSFHGSSFARIARVSASRLLRYFSTRPDLCLLAR